MKPETEALLRQCRASLLLHSNEHVAALLADWFVVMIGEESMDEEIDDLCLLLDYRVQSFGAQTSYATYTSWWEVEGYLDPGEGVFTCADVTSLRLRLLDMSIKQFEMVIELGYQVRSLLAEMESKPRLPTGQEFLQEMVEWLKQAVPPLKPVQRATPPSPLLPLSSETKEQKRAREKEIVAQADQQGYLIVSADISGWVKDHFRHMCKVGVRPSIVIEPLEPPLARLSADFKTLTMQGADLPTPQAKEQLATLVAPYLARSQARLSWTTRRIVVLEGILAEDAEQAAQDIVALWASIVKNLPPVPVPTYVRPTPIDPPWKREITRLKEQEQALPLLPETVVLPAQWEDLITREHLLAFLPFLGLPARTRETKAPLIQRLQERLETDAIAKAQFFEVFVHELAVPPWELETLLGCSTSERKRWTEEGKISILDYGSFRKGGSDRSYPLFDRRIILSISPTDLETWRAEHQALVKAHRSAGARAAAASRKARQSGLLQMAD